MSFKILNRIKELNPEKIEVEDICKEFEISRVQARTLCEMAVSDGLFKRCELNNVVFYVLVK